MKALMGSCVFLAICLGSALAGGAQWQTDYEKALAAAKAKSRNVFVNFTGSDWCGPCIALHKSVFSKKEFLDYANKNLILLEVDYPKTKSLPDEINRQNERLKYQFNINKLGFPTYVLIDAGGNLLGTHTGYNDEKPADIIAQIEKWAKL
jgi:thiol-disulfide isomerase/thioredoxin